MARKLIIEVIAEAAGAERTLRSIDQHSEKLGHSLGGIGKAALLGGAGFVAFEGAKETLIKAFEAGETLRKSQESLETAIAHTGGNVDALRGKYEDIAKSAANFGITEDQANIGLAKATVLTGDSEKAIRAYQEAVDIAAATHKNLQAVLVATSKAQDGNTGALSRYGIQLDKNASSSEQFREVMKRFGGQAEANTSQVDILKAHLANWREELGAKLVPAINNVIGFVSDHWPEVQATFQRVSARIMEIWQKDLQPTFELIKAVVTRLISQIIPVLEGLWQEFKGIVNLIDDLIHGRWSQIWGDLKEIVSGATKAVVAALRGLLDDAGLLAGKIGSGIYNGIVGALQGLGHALVQVLKGALNYVIDQWNDFKIHIDAVKVLGITVFPGADINFPNIPHLAQGGIVSSPTLALIGESGPEAVVPLGKGRSMGSYHFYFPNYVGDKNELMGLIRTELTRAQRRGTVLGFT